MCIFLCAGVIASNELQEFVSNLFNVMEYLFSKCVNPVQKILESFGNDLTIKCDSRHFFFIFSKLEHLKLVSSKFVLSMMVWYLGVAKKISKFHVTAIKLELVNF